MRKYLCLLSLVLLFAASCTHKELCESHPHTIIADISFDWSNVDGASPGSMSLYLFPKGKDKALRYEFGSHDGGQIKINPGEYRAIFLNSDTRNIYLENKDSFEEFVIKSEDAVLHANLSMLSTSADAPPRARGTQDERIAASPECVWAGSVDTFIFDESHTSLRLSPEPAFTSFSVDIQNIDNAEFVYALSGSLSTLADGFIPSTGVVSDEVATVPFPFVVTADNRSAAGSFRAFGHCPQQDMTHYLTIYATLINGSSICYTFDVTEQMHNATDSGNITIKLDALPLPIPEYPEGSTSGGIVPSITGWDTVEINISM